MLETGLPTIVGWPYVIKWEVFPQINTLLYLVKRDYNPIQCSVLGRLGWNDIMLSKKTKNRVRGASVLGFPRLRSQGNFGAAVSARHRSLFLH